MVYRIHVEKKPGFNVEAMAVFHDLSVNLGIKGLDSVRIIHRYDVEGIGDEDLAKAEITVFSEPPVDFLNHEIPGIMPLDRVFGVEYLPGQYDQRADSAAQAVMLLTHGAAPLVRTARLYVLSGLISDEEFDTIKRYVINPVEARESGPDKFDTLSREYPEPPMVDSIDGFISLPDDETGTLVTSLGLAMSGEDILYCREYFRKQEKRDPTITEIRMIDTYWSDHCRHTTFLASIDRVTFPDNDCGIEEAWKLYLETRERVYGSVDRPVTLMDIAVLAAKALRKDGRLDDLDESEEINACSIAIDVEIDGKNEPWLLMFKNETHNHPTEIEPFGGAATCLGGAIRDPLSGRSYVYQAMRVTGAGDPRTPVSGTIPGKLPQRKICTVAAHGYSSYGNQIGLATGQVSELYHPGYVAKRMEIGAVIGAAPAANVRRERPSPGDVVILVGGATGRDGIGGATGSSREHTEESLEKCGAEVQKGNPPTERKIQRLFRDRRVSTLIKRCNDFGAGGVSVAIGELADGLIIDLDKIPRKYEGLDGTELAISESQERMAVVVDASDVYEFVARAAAENLDAVPVAEVSSDSRLVMCWKGRKIVDLSRDFLDTNGVAQHTEAIITNTTTTAGGFTANGNRETLCASLGNLERASRKGLAERFDSTIGSGTVLMPFGGKNQLTPSEGMVALIPVISGETATTSVMTWGFDPGLSSENPFLGASCAVISSLAKITALGADYRKARLSFQEYFEKLKSPQKWGKPLAALLGAFKAQMELGTPAIGGKDSMSGTFMNLDVPPTLVSFAVCASRADNICTSEFKSAENAIVLFTLPVQHSGLPDYSAVRTVFDSVREGIRSGIILSAGVLGERCMSVSAIWAKAAEMAFGNGFGCEFHEWTAGDRPVLPGSIIVETTTDNVGDMIDSGAFLIGHVREDARIIFPDGSRTGPDECLRSWSGTLEDVYPVSVSPFASSLSLFIKAKSSVRREHSAVKTAKPRVIIPVFPGTNCEYDSARAFTEAGALPETLVIRNRNPRDIEESISALATAISASQIIMLPGGFSAGDEPEGSGKFIAAFFRNRAVSDAVADLLENRDGLILGICNGFQALIKLGLLPCGEIRPLDKESPSLTFNTIGRHVSCLVNTRVVNNYSPWLSRCRNGDIHTVAVSHGEGRFIASDPVLEDLVNCGQVAFQYVDGNGMPVMDMPWNPNGSLLAIEGITSRDGRILGKMGHSERRGQYLYRNVPGNKNQQIFEAGTDYFL